MAPQEEGGFGWHMGRPTCPPSEAESRGGRGSAPGASAGRPLHKAIGPPAAQANPKLLPIKK